MPIPVGEGVSGESKASGVSRASGVVAAESGLSGLSASGPSVGVGSAVCRGTSLSGGGRRRWDSGILENRQGRWVEDVDEKGTSSDHKVRDPC